MKFPRLKRGEGVGGSGSHLSFLSNLLWNFYSNFLELYLSFGSIWKLHMVYQPWLFIVPLWGTVTGFKQHIENQNLFLMRPKYFNLSYLNIFFFFVYLMGKPPDAHQTTEKYPHSTNVFSLTYLKHMTKWVGVKERHKFTIICINTILPLFSQLWIILNLPPPWLLNSKNISSF